MLSKISNRQQPDSVSDRRVLMLTFILQTSLFIIGFLYIYFVEVLRVPD